MADRGWNWHAWMKKDGIRKYCGFFESEDSALTFKRNNPDREFITITNYGPLDLAKQAAPAKPVVQRTARAAVPMTREQMMERDRRRTALESAQATARAEADRKFRESQKAAREKREVEAARRAENDKEMAGIRKDAKAGLEKHKADEKRDLDAGINR